MQKIEKKRTWKTLCQIASCPVNASGKLTPCRAIQSISFSHLSQSHQANESSTPKNETTLRKRNKTKIPHEWKEVVAYS